jgi:hypothetical protein
MVLLPQAVPRVHLLAQPETDGLFRMNLLSLIGNPFERTEQDPFLQQAWLQMSWPASTQSPCSTWSTCPSWLHFRRIHSYYCTTQAPPEAGRNSSLQVANYPPQPFCDVKPDIEARSCTDNYSSRNEDEPASKSLDVNSPLSPKGYRRLRRASAAPTASQYSGKISSRIQLQASQQDKSGAKIRSRHSQASNYFTKQKSTNLPRSRNKVTGHERGLKKHEFEKKTNCCRTRLPNEMKPTGRQIINSAVSKADTLISTQKTVRPSPNANEPPAATPYRDRVVIIDKTRPTTAIAHVLSVSPKQEEVTGCAKRKGDERNE